jgi:hypothetical protein
VLKWRGLRVVSMVLVRLLYWLSRMVLLLLLLLLLLGWLRAIGGGRSPWTFDMIGL